jgi:hypothetical protein
LKLNAHRHVPAAFRIMSHEDYSASRQPRTERTDVAHKTYVASQPLQLRDAVIASCRLPVHTNSGALSLLMKPTKGRRPAIQDGDTRLLFINLEWKWPRVGNIQRLGTASRYKFFCFQQPHAEQSEENGKRNNGYNLETNLYYS